MNTDNPTNRVKTIFVPPPVIATLKEVYDINKDPQLRKNVTIWYQKKIISWITSKKTFKHTKNNLKLLKTNEGYKIIYQLLRKFVKKYDANWYDLRKLHYDQVKDYLRFELGKKL